MKINHIITLFIISIAQIAFGQEYQVKKNEFGDLIIMKNGKELDCFYRGSLQYNCDYTYFVKDNIIYFLGCSFRDFPSNGNMKIVYTFERFSILKCTDDLKIEYEKSVNKDNHIKYIITENGLLIKLKNDVEIEKISVLEVKKNVFQ